MLQRIMIGCVAVIGVLGAIRFELIGARDAQIIAVVVALAALASDLGWNVVKKKHFHG